MLLAYKHHTPCSFSIDLLFVLNECETSYFYRWLLSILLCVSSTLPCFRDVFIHTHYCNYVNKLQRCAIRVFDMEMQFKVPRDLSENDIVRHHAVWNRQCFFHEQIQITRY